MHLIYINEYMTESHPVVLAPDVAAAVERTFIPYRVYTRRTMAMTLDRTEMRAAAATKDTGLMAALGRVIAESYNDDGYMVLLPRITRES